jgi:hypothetical protein
MDLLGAFGPLIAIIALGLAANRWGIDSTDGPESAEWDLRRFWRGYGAPGGQ